MKTSRSSGSKVYGLRACLIAGAVLVVTPPAGAQMPPGAGDVLREASPPERVLPGTEEAPLLPERAAPAPAAAAGPSFVLRAVRFAGNSAFTDAQLQAEVAPWLGKEVSFADLQAMAAQVSARYREAGFLLAEAIVPAQAIEDGRVELSVIEGRMGAVRTTIDAAAPVREAVIRDIAAGLPSGEPLRGAELERTMLLLSDLPGLRPEAALEPGTEPGSVDLVLEVAPRRRWDLMVDVDNHGSRSTSEYRAGLLGRINSPLRLGDNLDVRLQAGTGGRLAYGRVGYELPVGGRGTRFGVSVARVEYELGEEFAALDANGEADLVEVGLTHPFVRSRARNLFGRLGWQAKRLDDRLDAVGFTEDKKLRSVHAGLNYEQRDDWLGGGYMSAELTVHRGRLRLDPDALALDQAGRRSAGNFTRWTYGLSRLNALMDKTSLYFAISGQFASRNLDSAEKVALGGPRAVRAYAPSEATVDVGHVATLELRRALTPELSVQLFHDWGWGHSDRHALGGTDNSVSLRGAGVGAFWSLAGETVLRTSLAWRTSARGEVDRDRVPRLYVQLTHAF